MQPVVLTIAGSDSSGGAGVQADVRTITAFGAWPATVVTAVTAQDAGGVRASAAMDAGLVRAQLRAVLEGMDVAAVKTGMLASAAVVRVVAEALAERQGTHVVCDPVLRSGGGHALLEESAIDVLRDTLLPVVSLVTPNAPEAGRLTGCRVRTVEDAERAGRALIDRGAGAALVTGGHLEQDPGTDVLVTPDTTQGFAGDWIDMPPVHGTGCVLSSALAASLATGSTLPEAVERSRLFVREAIRRARDRSGLLCADPAMPAEGEHTPTGDPR